MEEVNLLWPEVIQVVKKTNQEKERERTYDTMLAKIFSKLQITTAEGIPSKVKEADVAKMTPTKFQIKNFDDICKSIHRAPADVAEFIKGKLKCDVALQEEVLVIKSKVNAAQIREIINQYVQQFVMCMSCGSFQTVITKAENLKDQILICESCKGHGHLKK